MTDGNSDETLVQWRLPDGRTGTTRLAIGDGLSIRRDHDGDPVVVGAEGRIDSDD